MADRLFVPLWLLSVASCWLAIARDLPTVLLCLALTLPTSVVLWRAIRQA